jgi:hypothetical protein
LIDTLTQQYQPHPIHDASPWTRLAHVQLFHWPIDSPPQLPDAQDLKRLLEANIYSALTVAVHLISDGLDASGGDDISAQPVGMITARLYLPIEAD